MGNETSKLICLLYLMIWMWDSVGVDITWCFPPLMLIWHNGVTLLKQKKDTSRCVWGCSRWLLILEWELMTKNSLPFIDYRIFGSTTNGSTSHLFSKSYNLWPCWGVQRSHIKYFFGRCSPFTSFISALFVAICGQPFYQEKREYYDYIYI